MRVSVTVSFGCACLCATVTIHKHTHTHISIYHWHIHQRTHRHMAGNTHTQTHIHTHTHTHTHTHKHTHCYLGGWRSFPVESYFCGPGCPSIVHPGQFSPLPEPSGRTPGAPSLSTSVRTQEQTLVSLGLNEFIHGICTWPELTAIQHGLRHIRINHKVSLNRYENVKVL